MSEVGMQVHGRMVEPEIISPGQDEEFEQLQVAARGYKTSLMTMAYYGFRIRLSEKFRDYGFESEDQMREFLDVPRSTWYKAVRIGEALNQLPLKDLQAISVGNAELLIQVQPSLWHDYPWVQEAKTLKPAQLAIRVAERNKRSGIDVTPMTYVRWKVPFLAKTAIENMVNSFQQRHNLSSPGQALEFIVADQYDMPNLLAHLNVIRTLLTQTIHSLHARRVSAAEELVWLKQARERLNEMIRPLYSKELEEWDAQYSQEAAEEEAPTPSV